MACIRSVCSRMQGMRCACTRAHACLWGCRTLYFAADVNGLLDETGDLSKLLRAEPSSRHGGGPDAYACQYRHSRGRHTPPCSYTIRPRPNPAARKCKGPLASRFFLTRGNAWRVARDGVLVQRDVHKVANQLKLPTYAHSHAHYPLESTFKPFACLGTNERPAKMGLKVMATGMCFRRSCRTTEFK